VISPETLMLDVGGEWDPHFTPVIRTFQDQVVGYPPGGGAALAVTVDGKFVIDVWGGESEEGVGWARDTAVVVFSVSKGATTYALQRLVDQGRLSVGLPIAEYWPAFGSNGKDQVTVEQFLLHTSGLGYWDDYHSLVSVDGPIEVWHQPDVIAQALAEAPLASPPGQLFYHALTFGWIAHGLVRALAGRSLGAFFEEEVAGPLDLNFHIGLPHPERVRVAKLLPFSLGPHGGMLPPRPQNYVESPQGKAVLAGKSGHAYIDVIQLLNSPEHRSHVRGPGQWGSLAGPTPPQREHSGIVRTGPRCANRC